MQGYDFRISLCRALACFMIIFIHTAASNFYKFGDQWWPTNFYDSLVRGATPLFLLISGAMLLPKEESLHTFFKKRFMRVLPALVFWSLVYLIWLNHLGKAPANWPLAILSGPVKSHLWFMYVIFGLYAAMPVMRHFYRHSTEAERFYFIVLWFITTCAYPLFRNIYGLKWNLAGSYHLYQFMGYMGYIVLGAWIYDLSKNHKTAKYAPGLFMYLGASLLIMLYTYYHSMLKGKPSEIFYDNLSPFSVLAAVGLFRFLLTVPITLHPMVARLVVTIADSSLGIFCLHILVRDILSMYFGISGSMPSPWWSIPVSAIVILFVSLAIIAPARKFKLLRYVT